MAKGLPLDYANQQLPDRKVFCYFDVLTKLYALCKSASECMIMRKAVKHLPRGVG